ncbi:MAG: Crp/Fnr family transcriptional regulator [Gillisia sp.]|nr:Crp/Fnr family transcriptional regulator [Gillisia sp.]
MEKNSSQVQFGPGEIIIKQDAPTSSVAYVKSGLVKIHVKGPIREKILNIVKAPAYLCLHSTFGDNVNHFSATAIEKTTVCFIESITFSHFIQESGHFAYQIIQDMGKGELKNFHNLINNAQKQNMGRVADALLFFAKEIYDSNSFTLPVSRQELADLTGITRESTSRIFTNFNNEKILNIEGRKITILNAPLLKQISVNG